MRIRNTTTSERVRNILFLDILIYIIFFIFIALSLRYQYFLLSYKEWGDESETIVAAKMMAAGMVLYSEIFNHHGPLTFLPGLLIEYIGDYGISEHRIAIAIFQILAVLSIYTSPLLKFKSQKIIATITTATIILVFMPSIFGHMYKYQTIAGIFLVIILSKYTLPAILANDGVNNSSILLGNFLIASLPFLAITYLPIAALLFIASLRVRKINIIFIGIILGLAINILFLMFYGSFSGYLAFHIYLNSKVLPDYTGLQPGLSLIVYSLKAVTSDLGHFISLIIILMSSIILSSKEPNIPWRTLLVISGLLSLLIRGSGFHGMPFYYALMPLISLCITRNYINVEKNQYILLTFIILCLIKISLVLPGDRQELVSERIPHTTEFSRLVQEVTSKDDKIIAYSFQNFEYIISKRLPASGHFFYLPWQEKYNENPILGISIDACQQIKNEAPKIMMIDKYKVWNLFSWDSYAKCIQEYLNTNYWKVDGKPFYIRNDIFRLKPSRPLTPENSIKLKFDESVIKLNKNLNLGAIEIMFGTYRRTNNGVAQLVLENKYGRKFEIQINLSELNDNEYKRFSIPGGNIFAGDIKWDTGGGVSVWERYNNEGSVTCINYIYSDGSFFRTEGCKY